jgi:hypothetical protein
MVMKMSVPRLAIIAAAGLAIAGCAHDYGRHGYVGASIGYAGPYYGWYDNYYYPASACTSTNARARAITGTARSGIIGNRAVRTPAGPRTGAPTALSGRASTSTGARATGGAEPARQPSRARW